MIDIKVTPQEALFKVYVQPKASKNAIVGAYQDALKIKLTAPPAEGAANRQCVEVLAKALGIPKSAITITGGLSSRHKQIRIEFHGRLAEPERLRQVITRLQDLARSTGA